MYAYDSMRKTELVVALEAVVVRWSIAYSLDRYPIGTKPISARKGTPYLRRVHGGRHDTQTIAESPAMVHAWKTGPTTASYESVVGTMCELFEIPVPRQMETSY